MRLRNFLILVLLALLPVALLQAQRPGRGRGMPKYDPATVVTMKGTVAELTQHTGPMGWSGTHVALKTEEGVADVHLGPTAFLDQQEVKFAQGDAIEVTGSKVKYEGADALIAREIKRGDKVLTLRDEQGIPKWSRSRWRW